MPRTVSGTFLGLVLFRLAIHVTCYPYAASGQQPQEYEIEQQLQPFEIDSTKLCQEFHFDEEGNDVAATNRHSSHPACPSMNLFQSALSSVTTICTNESTAGRRGGCVLIEAH